MENLGVMIGNTQKSLNPRAKRFFKQRPVFYKITVSQLYSLTIIKFLLQAELVKIKENLLALISQPVIRETKYYYKLHNIKFIILDFFMT